VSLTARVSWSRSRPWLWAAFSVAALGASCHRDAPSAVVSSEPATPSEGDTSFPVRIADDLKRTVVLAAEPRRIVALLPSHTETLFALGVGDRVVGVDDFSDYPEAATHLPKLGGLYDARLESLLSLEPDLVLMSEASRSIQPLERAGATVWAGSASTFDDVFRVIEAIGRLVGRAARARAMTAAIRDQIDGVERAAHRGPPPTVYFELDATPYAAGAPSFIGGLIARAGGINIVPSELGEFPKLNPEWIIARDPDVILGASREELLGRPGWAALSAIRNHRTYSLSEEERRTIVRPGPRLGEGLRSLAALLYREP
jgi:iron complex transport system substrate-binding protein